MAKRRHEPDSEGITAETAEYNTVFVDTSLDTHIATLVSSSDTVSDFRKKLVLEHMQCFPEAGEIQIDSLKVKRRGNYYHLPDIMLVWSAFHGVKGCWFLSADASGAPICQLNQNLLELGTSNGLKMDVRNVDDDCRSFSSDANRIQARPSCFGDGVTEKNVVSEMIDGFKVEKSLEKDAGSQSNNYLQVNCTGAESRPSKKQKHKISHSKNKYHDPTPEEGPASIPEIVVVGNSMVDAVKGGPESVILYEKQGKPIISEAAAEIGVRNDQSNIEDMVACEGTAPATAEKNNPEGAVDSQNLLGSGKRKEDTLSESIIPENLVATNLESEHGQHVLPVQSGGVSIKLSDVPARSINAGGTTGDVSSDGNKRRKKKSLKTDAEVQGATDVKQTRKGESTESYFETHELEKQEERRDLSLNHDHEIIIPSNSKASVHADPKGASFSPHLSDANAMEPDISSGSMKKKKKRGMKSASTNLEKSGTEQANNGINTSTGLLYPSTNHIPVETAKEEIAFCHKGPDVQIKLLDDSTKDASEKAQGSNADEGDFVILTQTEQTMEGVITEENKNQSSVGNCDAAIGEENLIVEINKMEKESAITVMDQGANTDDAKFAISTQTMQTLEDRFAEEKKTQKKDQSSADNHDAAIVEENQIVEFKQVEKGNKNTEDKERKAKKKIKKRRVMASDVQENLPIKDQKVGDGVSTTEANSISLVNSKEEGRHVATAEVVSHKSEEKPEKMPEFAVNTGDLAKTLENGGAMAKGADTDDANFAISTQTMQTLKDKFTEEKKTQKKDQSSADNHDAAVGEENQILEFKQVEKGNKNTEDKEKKAKKKIKKRRVMALDQENLPIKDQKVGNEVLTTEVNSVSLVNFKKECRRSATSLVLSRKSEEKPVKMHECAVNTDDLAETPKNGEGINFKQYFVPGQYQDQVDSSDEVKKATKANEEMKSWEKDSLSISTKLQNSLKSLENNDGENKSRVKKKVNKRQGDSARKSGQDEVSSNSSKRSLKVSENGVKDSSPSGTLETTLQKSNEIRSASSYPNKKKPFLDISSSERSITVPKKSGNKKLQSGLNATNKTPIKPPKKSSLLSKRCVLFHDSGSGGSEDENETVRLNVGTQSPSDTSSLSDYSEGGSDLSQDSPRTVSSDAKGRSTGGKNMSKLDLSASKDMTMDMILRSSKRFKKAKLLVDSQNNEQDESQQVEFVPESQPI